MNDWHIQSRAHGCQACGKAFEDKRDVVCLNAAPAFVAGKKARTLQEGFELANKALDSGAAMDKLEKLIAFTNKKHAA